MPVTFSWPVPTPAPATPSSIIIDAVGEAGATAPRDEELSDFNGDQVLVAGDQVLLVGQDGVLSDVLARWQLVKGEWYLDTSIGVDWYGVVLVKNPNLGNIRAEFEREALKAPGITALLKFDQTFDAARRSLSVDFALQDDLGNIISDSAILFPGGST